MNEFPSWVTVVLAATVPALAILGFWMSLSSRLTKAELTADMSSKDVEAANQKIALLTASFAIYREQIARDYIHRETMTDVENRLTQAIDRLGDRFDRLFESKIFESKL